MTNTIAVAICIFIFSLNISAQQKKDLIGTWKTVRTDSNGIAVPPLTIEHFSFYKSGSCRVDEALIQKDSTNKNAATNYVYARKWKLDRRDHILLVKQVDKFSPVSPREYKILALTDSVLDLSYSNGKTVYTLHLVKVATVEEIELYRRLTRKESRKYEKYYYLVNSADTTKKIRIKHYDRISLTIEAPFTDSTIESISSWTEGSIYEVNDSALHLDADSYRTKITYKSDSTVTLNKDYPYDANYIKNIDLGFVKSVTYSSSIRESVNAIAAAMIYVSAQTLLVVAPLVSIKYKRGDGAFNTKRYFQWAAASLIGLAVSIPAATFSTQRSYLITSKGNKKGKEYWYFEN
jgi:hypothetical protein